MRDTCESKNSYHYLMALRFSCPSMWREDEKENALADQTEIHKCWAKWPCSMCVFLFRFLDKEITYNGVSPLIFSFSTKYTDIYLFRSICSQKDQTSRLLNSAAVVLQEEELLLGNSFIFHSWGYSVPYFSQPHTYSWIKLIVYWLPEIDKVLHVFWRTVIIFPEGNLGQFVIITVCTRLEKLYINSVLTCDIIAINKNG